MDCCLPFVRNNDQRHCARFFLYSWFDLFQCNRNLYSELTRSYIQVQNHFSDIYSQQIKCCTVPLHNLCYCKSCLPLESCMFSCTAYSQWNICWEVRLSYLSSVRGCLFVCLLEVVTPLCDQIDQIWLTVRAQLETSCTCTVELKALSSTCLSVRKTGR